MSRPLVTIVTPSFNQGEYLEDTILSVLKQDYPHIEYIVIDGGSTDQSVEILERYSGQLSYWCSEPDKGQSDAIAKGLERGTGEIQCWLASDDLLLPGAISRVVEYFEQHPEMECVTGGCYFIDSEGEPVEDYWIPYTLGVGASYGRFRYYEQDGISQQSTFWRRCAYEAVGGLNRSRVFTMDLDLFARLAKRKRFGRIPSFLACFRMHEQAKTSQIQHVRRQEAEEFAQQHGRYKRGRLLSSLLYWRYRLPSLLRKGWLMALHQTGLVKLKPISYVSKDENDA